MSSAGGLGGEQDSYFLWEETQPGRIDFAYTRRYFGPGASGDVNLLRVEFESLEETGGPDFALDSSPGALLARDSAKRQFEVVVDVEVPQ